MWGNRQPYRWYGIIIFALSIGIALTYIRGNMGSYIHPRYHEFTIILALVSAILAIIGAWQYTYKGVTDVVFNNKLHLLYVFCRWLLSRNAYLVIIFSIILLIDPQFGISTSLASKRSSFNDLSTSNVSSAEWFTEPESFYEIAMVANDTKGVNILNGKTVDITGFVQYNNGVLQISRYIMSCCAIDSKPASIALMSKEDGPQYTEGEWIRIKGSFTKIRKGGDYIISLQPETIERVAKPKPEYDYISY